MQCSICLDDLEGGPTLACGHRFHAACLARLAGANGTTPTRRGALTACPNCRTVSRVALATPVAAFGVGDRVEALWGQRWYPGVVDAVVDGAYNILWDDGDEGEVRVAHVRAAPAFPTAGVPRRPPSCLPPRHVLLQNCDDDEDDGAAFGIESSATSFSAHGSGDLRAPSAAPTPSTRPAHTRPTPRAIVSTGGRFPCPAGCGRTFDHGPAAVAHGKSCTGTARRPVRTPPPAPTPRSSDPPPASRAVAPRARPRARPAPAPLPPATRPHVASTASAWVAVCTDLLEAAKDRTNMRGLREPLASRGFRCGPDRRPDGTFSVNVPPDFPCYYDVTGKDYAVQGHATTLASLRKYLEGTLAIARAGDAYRTEAEYEDARASVPVRAKTSRFTGVTWDRCGKWRAAIKVRRCSIALGAFDDEEDAARAYDAALVKYELPRRTLNFPGEAPLASVLAALPDAPAAAPPRRSGRAPAPKLLVDPEAPARKKARTFPKKPPYYGKYIEGATQKQNGKWSYPKMFPGREFDDLDELRAAKRQRAARLTAYSAQTSSKYKK